MKGDSEEDGEWLKGVSILGLCGLCTWEDGRGIGTLCVEVDRVGRLGSAIIDAVGEEDAVEDCRRCSG